MSTRKKAILALIIANIIWGAASPIFKWSLQNVTPWVLAFLRFSLASFLLFPFAYKCLSINKKDVLSIISVGLFGVGINIPFFFFGLKMAPAINAPMIASSGPIFLIISSIIFLGEKPKRKVILGTFISLLGVLIIILRPLIETGFDGSILGNIFFLIATFGSVGHAIFCKQILKKYSPLVVTFWSFIVGSLIFLPFFLNEVASSNFLAQLDYRGIIGIIFGVVFSSTLGYFLYSWGIQKIEANEVGIFAYIDPVVAILIAIPLLGEKITPVFVLGSLFVFIGILAAQGRFSYHYFFDLFKKNGIMKKINN